MVTSSDSSKAPNLIDGRVSVDQCKKAITALLNHVRARQAKEDEKQLLPGKEQHVWLVMSVKRMPPSKNLKPHRIPLQYPLVDPRTTSICLITKDPQREYKDLLESHDIKFISRVVGVEKLRGKFKGFDARRLLVRENGLFLADDRVVPLLPRLLGKEWFRAKKQPIPVSLTKKDLKGTLEKAVSSTYMHQNQGTCTTIKIATLSHKDDQVLANLQAAIPAVVKRIHEGWDNVQNLHIKTSNSVSLPIWTCPLGSDEPGSRWKGMSVDEEWTGIGGVENEGVETDDKTNLDGAEVPPSASTTISAPVTTESEPTIKKSKRKRQVTDDSAVAPTSVAVENEPTTKKKRQVTNDSAVTPTPVVTESKLTAKKPKKKQQVTDDSAVTQTPVGTESERTTEKSKKGRQVTDDSAVIPTPASSSAPTTLISKPAEKTESPKPLKRSQKKQTAADEPVPASPTPALASAPKPVETASSKSSKTSQRTEPTLNRKELEKKKDTLGATKVEKKKQKARTPEKSARKGVKAQLIGKVKA